MIVYEPPGTRLPGPRVRPPGAGTFLREASRRTGWKARSRAAHGRRSDPTLNRKYRRKDKATDVLSFPAAWRAEGIAGDLVISLETALRQARRRALARDGDSRSSAARAAAPCRLRSRDRLWDDAREEIGCAAAWLAGRADRTGAAGDERSNAVGADGKTARGGGPRMIWLYAAVVPSCC